MDAAARRGGKDQGPDKATRDALRRLSDELDERPAVEEAAADVNDQDHAGGERGDGGG